MNDIPRAAVDTMVKIMRHNEVQAEALEQSLRDYRDEQLENLAASIEGCAHELSAAAGEIAPMQLPALDVRYDLLDLADKLRLLKGGIV